jgi:hypothetical protein
MVTKLYKIIFFYLFFNIQNFRVLQGIWTCGADGRRPLLLFSMWVTFEIARTPRGVRETECRRRRLDATTSVIINKFIKGVFGLGC